MDYADFWHGIFLQPILHITQVSTCQTLTVHSVLGLCIHPFIITCNITHSNCGNIKSHEKVYKISADIQHRMVLLRELMLTWTNNVETFRQFPLPKVGET